MIHGRDPGSAVQGIGVDAGLASRQRDGRLAHGPQRHGHQGAGDGLSGGEQEVHLPLVRLLDTWFASRISSSVVFPMAETTTTTWFPALPSGGYPPWPRPVIRSAVATEEPPYFWTIKAIHVPMTARLVCEVSLTRSV